MGQVQLDELTRVSSSPLQLALARIECLNATPEHDIDDIDEQTDKRTSNQVKNKSIWNDDTSGLARVLVEHLETAATITTTTTTTNSKDVMQILQILVAIQATDVILSHELSRQEGFVTSLNQLESIASNANHTELSELIQTIKYNATLTQQSSLSSSSDTDTDAATQLLQFSVPELKQRLPLLFEFAPVQILIHEFSDQNQNEAMHDTGFVMWPSAVSLSQYLCQHQYLVQDAATILELGAGCGLVGLTAARLIQQQQEDAEDNTENSINNRLVLTDYNPAVLTNLTRNILLNDLDPLVTTVAGLDFFDQEDDTNDTTGCNTNDNDNDNDNNTWQDMEGHGQPQVQLVLAADVLAYSNDSDLVAQTLQSALVPGGRAIVVSAAAHLRFGVEGFPDACRQLGLEITTTTLEMNRLQNATMLGQTTGFVDGYTCVMFDIHKQL